jgi:tRNA-specific 2-thiouridylase
MIVSAVVRYRMRPVPAIALCDGFTLRVTFEQQLDSVAPGQAVVCYLADECIGGGIIECAS